MDGLGWEAQLLFLSPYTDGVFALATNRKIFPKDAIPMHEAWRVYDQIISDERVVFAEEPENVEAALRNFTQRGTFSTNVWSDAYLAAFAVTADFEFLTFDKGFTQYANLRCAILS